MRTNDADVDVDIEVAVWLVCWSVAWSVGRLVGCGCCWAVCVLLVLCVLFASWLLVAVDDLGDVSC